MKPPFELPVKLKDKCQYTGNNIIEIIDGNSAFVATVRNIEIRDYIVQVINSREKLVKLLRDAQEYIRPKDPKYIEIEQALKTIEGE